MPQVFGDDQIGLMTQASLWAEAGPKATGKGDWANFHKVMESLGMKPKSTGGSTTLWTNPNKPELSVPEHGSVGTSSDTQSAQGAMRNLSTKINTHGLGNTEAWPTAASDHEDLKGSGWNHSITLDNPRGQYKAQTELPGGRTVTHVLQPPHPSEGQWRYNMEVGPGKGQEGYKLPSTKHDDMWSALERMDNHEQEVGEADADAAKRSQQKAQEDQVRIVRQRGAQEAAALPEPLVQQIVKEHQGAIARARSNGGRAPTLPQYAVGRLSQMTMGGSIGGGKTDTLHPDVWKVFKGRMQQEAPEGLKNPEALSQYARKYWTDRVTAHPVLGKG